MSGEVGCEAVLHCFAEYRCQGDWSLAVRKVRVTIFEDGTLLGMSPYGWNVEPLPAKLVQQAESWSQIR